MSLSPKQEAFAQAVASGVNQSHAYRLFYNVSPDTLPGTVYTEATCLVNGTGKANPQVSHRIAELRAKAAETHAWTRDRIITQAEKHVNIALGGGFRGVPAANSALELIGRITGLLAEKPTPVLPGIQIVFITEGQENKVVEGHLVAPRVDEVEPAVTDTAASSKAWSFTLEEGTTKPVSLKDTESVTLGETKPVTPDRQKRTQDTSNP